MDKDRHVQVEKMDLWAGLNGDGLPSGTERQSGVPRGKRRLTERAVRSLLRDWLLQHYTAAYCRSLAATRIFRRCYWIDALGSDGRALVTASNPESIPVPSSGKGRKKGTIQQVPPALGPLVTLSRELMQE